MAHVVPPGLNTGLDSAAVCELRGPDRAADLVCDHWTTHSWRMRIAAARGTFTHRNWDRLLIGDLAR